MVDLLLIHPSLDIDRDRENLRLLRVDNEIPRQESPPLGIAYLIAVAKRCGFQAKFIDMVAYGISLESVLEYTQEWRPRLVGFTAPTVRIKAAGYTAKEIKRVLPQSQIGVGGAHATMIPDETLDEFKSFDFVVRGEGELVVRQILENDNTSGVLSCGNAKLDSLPFPAWEEFELDKYQGADPHRTKLELPISTSRGCPFSCIFCARPFGRYRRRRSVASVIEEIERNIDSFGCEALVFCDETFIVDLKYANDLFQSIIRRGLHKKVIWSCETRIDLASPELFRLMKKAGCYYVYFGFETGDDTILKIARKNFTVEQVKPAVKWAKDAGLICAGSFIIGLPGESEETVDKSIKLAQELNIYSTTFPLAVPFPGTVLRAMAIRGEYGLRVLTDDWDDYGKQYPGVMESDRLSIERLRALQRKAYEYNPKKELPSYGANS